MAWYIFVTLLGLLMPKEQVTPAIETHMTDLIYCSTIDGAKRVASAIAAIKTHNDGYIAYQVYLDEPECSFTNIADVDTNKPLWASSPDIAVSVFKSELEIGTPDPDHEQYVVLAPLTLMDIFRSCEKFLENDFEGERSISGCQTSL